MTDNQLLEEYQDNRLRRTLPDILYRYLVEVGCSEKVTADDLHFVSGLPFTNLIPTKPAYEMRDITCIPALIDTPCYLLLSYLKQESSFELIQKWDNVYNHQYYHRRILNNHLLQRPAMARNVKGDGLWDLVAPSKYREENICILSESGSYEVKDWYETVEELLLIQTPKAKNLVIPLQKVLQFACEQYSSFGTGVFYSGAQAHLHVLRCMAGHDEMRQWEPVIKRYCLELTANRYFCTCYMQNNRNTLFSEYTQLIDRVCTHYRKLCEAGIKLIDALSKSPANNNFCSVFEQVVKHDAEAAALLAQITEDHPIKEAVYERI